MADTKTKADHIREALVADWEGKPKDIAEMLSKKLGKEVKAQEVSQYKLKIKKERAEAGEGKKNVPEPQVPAETPTQASLDEALDFLDLARKLGKEQALKLLKRL